MQPASFHHVAPGLSCGVTEDMIRDLVHAFYRKVREDELLGSVFNNTVEDWDVHLAKLCDFWSSLTLASGKYKGKPVPVHLALPGITPDHFVRWLDIFRNTAKHHCPENAAALFVSRAERVAESLQLSITINKGELTARPPGKTE